MQYQRIQGSLYKSHHHHPRPRLEAPCMERLVGSRELDKSSPICPTKPGLGDWKKKPGPGDRNDPCLLHFRKKQIFLPELFFSAAKYSAQLSVRWTILSIVEKADRLDNLRVNGDNLRVNGERRRVWIEKTRRRELDRGQKRQEFTAVGFCIRDRLRRVQKFF